MPKLRSLCWPCRSLDERRLTNFDTAALEAQIDTARNRIASLSLAQERAPTDFQSLAKRISEARSKLQVANRRLDDTELRLGRRLESLAVARLKSLQSRIDNYLLHARYSLAQVYDRAAVSGDT